MRTPGWLSTAVENIYDFLTGIVVALGIIILFTPPNVSIPKDKGVASKTTILLILSSLVSVNTAA